MSLMLLWTTGFAVGSPAFAMSGIHQLIAHQDQPTASASPLTLTSGSLSFLGWALDSDGIASVQIKFDGKTEGYAQYGISRPDVYKVYPSITGSRFSGYKYTLNGIGTGLHTVTVEAVSKTGQTYIISQMTVDRKSASSVHATQNNFFAHQDQPTASASPLTLTSGSLSFLGWALDSEGIASVQIKFDGKTEGYAQYGISRPDVYKVYPSITGSRFSGYKYTLNGIGTGLHTVTVEAVSKTRQTYIISQMTVDRKSASSVHATQNNFFAHQDQPTASASPLTLTSGSLSFLGWALDSEGIASVQIKFDGKTEGYAQYGISRPDVYKVYPSITGSRFSGYKYTLNGIGTGLHTVTVEAVSKTGQTYIISQFTADEQHHSLGLQLVRISVSALLLALVFFFVLRMFRSRR